jgi:hypothetical protein
MRFRNTLILAVVLALGIWSVVSLNKRDVKKEELKKSDEKILAVETGKIREIWLQPGEVHAIRDSAEWRIVAPIQTTGDKSTLDAIINIFDWAKMERVISSDPAEYPEFGLQPARRTLIVKHDQSIDTVYVGDTNPTGSYVFARKSGSNKVFLTTTSLDNNTQKSLFDLRDKSALVFDRTIAKEIELTTGTLHLMFSKEGDQWQITQPRTLAADNDKVGDILSKVANQRVSSFEDENPQDLKKYGLDKPVVVFDVLLGESRAQRTLIIGKQVEGQFYAKDKARKPVFKVDTSFVHGLQVSLTDVRSKKIVQLEVNDVSKLVVKQNDSTFVFQKDTTNSWEMTSPSRIKIKGWKITTLVSEIETLKVESFVTDTPSSLLPFGLTKPVVQCDLYHETRLIRQVMVGKSKDKNTVFFKTNAAPSVFSVKKEILEKLRIALPDLIETSDPPVQIQETKQM